MLHKLLRGAIHPRAARQLAAPNHAHQLHFHQIAQNLIHRHAANRLDFRTNARLPIRNNRQRFQRRQGKARAAPLLKQRPQPGAAVGVIFQPPATRHLRNMKPRLALHQIPAQLIHGLANKRLVGLGEIAGDAPAPLRRGRQHPANFLHRKRLLAHEQHRANNLFQFRQYKIVHSNLSLRSAPVQLGGADGAAPSTTGGMTSAMPEAASIKISPYVSFCTARA